MLTRKDLEDVLNSFPEMMSVVAAQAIAPCLRTAALAPGLKGIGVAASERIARRMAFNRRDFADGDTLIKEGDDATVAYVIRKGRIVSEFCDGRLEGFSNEVRSVGFAELFAERVCQETVRAKGPLITYRLTKEDAWELFEGDKDTMKQLRKQASLFYQRNKSYLISMKWSLLLEGVQSMEDEVVHVDALAAQKKAGSASQNRRGSVRKSTLEAAIGGLSLGMQRSNGSHAPGDIAKALRNGAPGSAAGSVDGSDADQG
mmetsp:Transcript_42832/g.67149  ORF Transcript_42832/g.67149 Transcript_42832/m.67149 type:complete len:259 (-) Transcript_42832:203-979(-)